MPSEASGRSAALSRTPKLNNMLVLVTRTVPTCTSILVFCGTDDRQPVTTYRSLWPFSEPVGAPYFLLGYLHISFLRHGRSPASTNISVIVTLQRTSRCTLFPCWVTWMPSDGMQLLRGQGSNTPNIAMWFLRNAACGTTTLSINSSYSALDEREQILSETQNLGVLKDCFSWGIFLKRIDRNLECISGYFRTKEKWKLHRSQPPSLHFEQPSILHASFFLFS